MTTALPLILEQTGRWYFWGIPMGLGPLAILLIAGRKDLVERWRSLNAGVLAVFGGLLLFGLFVIFQPLGWQLRVDQQGIRLRAPLELFTAAGTIPWKDLREVRFGLISSRYSSSTVEFVGNDGTVLGLKSLGGVPSSYWPALAAAIDAHSARGTLKPDTSKWIEYATSRGKSANLPLAGYVATDGTGRKMTDQPK